MKCAFTFAVEGQLRLAHTRPIPTKFGVYEFVVQDNRVTAIKVTVQLSPTDWPRATKDPAPGIRAHIATNVTCLPFIQQDLKTLQGLLCPFGLHSIDWSQPEVEWLPETDDERSALSIYSFKMRSEPVQIKECTSFDVAARAALSASKAYGTQVPLNFFRRAMLDVIKRAHVDAIYDFYFVLETLYADGKFKSNDVKSAFRANAELMECVRQALAEPPPSDILGRQRVSEYQERFGRMTPNELVDHLVDVRGKLHHHSMKDSRKPWHPEEQHEHELDSMMFQSVCTPLVLRLVNDHLYDDSIVEGYCKIVGIPRPSASDLI